MTDSFVPLHVHTEDTKLDGASRIDGLMRKVAEQGMPAIAITDHGNMFGAIDFYKAGQRHGVKPILGCELYVAPGSRFTKSSRKPADGGGRAGRAEPYHHLGVIAETQQGYRNLMRLISRAYLEGYWYKPRADKELLAEHAEGLIALSGCLGSELNQLLLADRYDQALEVAAWYRDVFGQDGYFIELQDHGIPEQAAVNGKLIKIADELSLGLVATNDSHYTERSDADAHDVLLCIQTGSKRDDTDRLQFKGDQFFVKSPAEMRALFGDHPGALTNTLLIAERCGVEIAFGQSHLPRFDCPDGLTEREYLRRKVFEGAASRYGVDGAAGELPREVTDRLEFELGVIEQMGFSGYFLIVADLCEYARSVGIRVGPGRGSAAGCAVAYCTGITDLDPLAYDLLFERFLNPERISMPDIDMDFDERRRGEMIRYARDKYGEDRVAQIITFSTIKAKAAIKDAARVLGYPYGFGDRLTKMMPPPVMGKDFPLEQSREMSGELRDAWANEPDARKVLDTALQLEGLRRQHSIHAAGVVISDDPITDHCPVLRVEADGEIVTQYDGGMVEDIGLLKMDFLGLRNLTVISDALDHIEAMTGERIAIEDIPLDDAPTYEMLSRGETDGVFQFESAGYKALCRQLKPDRFDDIIALGALYRPGPMSAGLHVEYAKRKHGQSPITVPHPDLEEILAPSYGLLIYQEQVQKIAQRIAGFSLGEADQIRKAMGKKLADQMAALREQFLEGTVSSGYEAKLGKDLWALIEGFASYAFNKSHSAAYGLVTYQTAWLKRHHPVAYMAALLTSVKNHKDKLPAALHSCRMMGITVLPPDVNESALDFAPAVGAEGGQAIRFGMSAVRNVGEQVVSDILAARREHGVFTDFSDFCTKVDAGVLNRRTIESLIKAGAFESLSTPERPHPRKGLVQVFEPIVDQALATKRAEAEGQFSLFGEATEVASEVAAVEIPDVEYERREKLAAEREMLGLYVSDHPLNGLERLLSDLTNASIPELYESGAGGRTFVTIGGILTGIQKKFTKTGQPYVVGTIEDLRGGIEVMFFPQAYQQYGEWLVEDAILCVSGRLDDGEPPRVIASEVTKPDLSEATGEPLTLTLSARQCTPEVVGRLKELLASHRGVVPVHLVLSNGKGRSTKLRLGDDLRVTRDAGLYGELKVLLGAGAVT